MFAQLSRRALLQNASRRTVKLSPCRKAHTEVQRPPGSPKGDGDDFRPPWVYALSRSGSWILIPVVSLYCVFVYDWGDHEHVFSAPRRWLARTKQRFFKLSPEEERLLNAEIVVQRVQRLPPGTIWPMNASPPIPKHKTPSPSESELLPDSELTASSSPVA